MYLKRTLAIISIIILIFPYSVVHATVNQVNEIEEIDVQEDGKTENVVSNEVETTNKIKESVTEEIVNETTNVVTNTVLNEISNEVINEVTNEIITNEVELEK